MNRICRNFMNGTCKRDPKSCRYVHDRKLCRNYYKGNCHHGDNCRFNHFVTLVRIRNTENYKPRTRNPDMRILVNRQPETQADVVIITDLFTSDEGTYYMSEILNQMRNKTTVWKSWHGDNHLIADDSLDWKSGCSAFNEVINRIEKYFHMTTKATRLNWYKTGNDFKPYHHDASAVKPDKARRQNITVGVNFGADRIISFEHAQSKTVVDIPLKNGDVYAFMRDVNVEWRHGVPQGKTHGERISIIDWGWRPNFN